MNIKTDVNHLNQCCKELETISVLLFNEAEKLDSVMLELKKQTAYRSICRKIESAKQAIEKENRNTVICAQSMLEISELYKKTENEVAAHFDESQKRFRALPIFRQIDLTDTANILNDILYGGNGNGQHE